MEISRLITEVYEDRAFMRKYDRTWGNAADPSIVTPFVTTLLKDPNNEGATVIDLGCGPGQYALKLCSAGFRTIVIDASQAAIDVTRDRLGRSGHHPSDSIVGDILQQSVRALISYRVGQVSGICCSGTFVHIPRVCWIDVLEWLRGMLLPDGTMCINIMVDNPTLIARDGRYFSYIKSAAEFEKILQRTGFTVQRCIRNIVSENAYHEPLLQTSWENFFVTQAAPKVQDLARIATTMTSFAYDRAHNLFAQQHTALPGRATFVENLASRLISLLPKTGGAARDISILDVGCGTGDIGIQLAKRGYTIVGIDLSEEMVADAIESARQSELAHADGGSQRSSIDFFVFDMCALPDEWWGSFDVILCITALQHQSVDAGRFAAALMTFARVLKAGGIARIDVRLGGESGFDPDLRYIQTFPDLEEVRPHLKAAGLDIIREPDVFRLNRGQNAYRRDLEISFAEIWLRKP